MFDLFSFNFAYLDAGTGSLIIQSVIGIVAGVTVFGRNAIAQVAAKAKHIFNKDQAKPEVEAKSER